MNDGDPTNPSRGRAQVPGASGGNGDAPGGRGGGEKGPASGRASIGGAPMTGGASTGRASVGGSAGRATVGRASAGGPADAGRARVPSQGGGSAGRATVGRARVGGPSDPLPPGADVIEGPGFAARLPGTGRPGRGGPGRGGPPGGAAAGRARRKRRRNWILASFAVFIMLAGTTVVGGTFFYDDVGLPNDLPQQKQATTIYFADNKNQMGKIGNENRTIIPPDQIPKTVKDAVVATEDKDFYHNSGISFTGILRAAWNNVTGGQRQGASTITQQYARNIADLKGITYSRKLREAVLAMKLSDTYKKDVILTAYLNTVYFGRQSYGIEAAAQAYFAKNAKDLTLEEGMALSSMIKNPGGTDGKGSLYDHTLHPQEAEDRFHNYIKPNLVEMKVITPEQAATMKYPAMRKYDPNDPAYQAQWGLNKPTGNVLHNVVDELTHLKNAKGEPMFPDLATGGYRIVTTIDYAMQAEAEKYGSGAVKESPLPLAKAAPVANVKPEENKIAAAVVSVEPYTGKVKAYYGGPSGAEPDMAGIWRDSVLTNDQSDNYQGFGRHRPASSFKIYTLGAALRSNISINSYWEAPPSKKYPGNVEIHNAENTNGCEGGGKVCRLWEATAESLNVPFYDVAGQVGPVKVLEFARDAGIRHIWNLDNGQQRYDLQPNQPVTNQLNDAHIGIGQYAVTVVDHAAGVATLAARGAAAPAHFVSQVYKGASLVYKEPFKPTQVQGYSQQMADDESFALQKVLQGGTGKNLALVGGRVAAAKTGTWQASESATDTKNNGNSNAWMIGYIPPDLGKKPQQFYGLATAVWMGAVKGDSVAVTIKGQPMFGSTGPGKIWKGYMDSVTGNMPKAKFPEPKYVGDDTLGNAPKPAVPTAPPGGDPNQPGQCLIPALCPTPPGGGNGGGTGGGGGLPGPEPSRPPRR